MTSTAFMDAGALLTSPLDQDKVEARNWLTQDVITPGSESQIEEPVSEFFKDLYMPGKTMPNLSRESDAIGFDLENSLIKCQSQ